MIIIKRLISPLAALGALICAPLALGQTGTSVDQGDWPYYHGSETSLLFAFGPNKCGERHRSRSAFPSSGLRKMPDIHIR